MIIDFHTHIFPPAVRDNREEYLRRDPTFAEMYSSSKAKIATARELLGSMEEAGVEVSVVLGFAWREHELCVRHNDYLLEAAASSGGRIVPFCMVNPGAGEVAAAEVARCLEGGARGLGELRPENQGYDLNGEAGELLATLAHRHDLILLFHLTEPVGHHYPGKQGLPLESFYRFVAAHPGVQVVGAHLAGGLPFFASMPEVQEACQRLFVDTAAAPFLYDESVYERVVSLLGPERLLMGSDYPLVSQRRQIEAIRGSGLDERRQSLILGENAQGLLSRGREAAK